ncbi:MAG TPA: hypothetical protein VMV91_13600 [Rhodocyclaceae bacterium]|nr:hypothetical protein [Rhodocyclaceae bacterium]
MLFWLGTHLGELFKQAFGPFVGAGLAFLTTRMHDVARRYRENVASGNLALFAVKSQLNEFLLFRKNLRQDMASKKRPKDSPLWLVIRPSFHTYVGYTIDFKSLGFLFENRGHGPLFDALHMSQTSYVDLIKADKFRNASVVELQREMAKCQSTNPESTLQDYQKAVGPYVIAIVEGAVVGLAKRARDDEKVYQEAFSELRIALEKELRGVWWRRDVWLRRKKPSFIDIEEPLPHFAKESLPDMPACVMQALASLTADDVATVQKAAGVKSISGGDAAQ